MAINDVVFDQGGAVYNINSTPYGGDLATLIGAIPPTGGGVAYLPPGTYPVSGNVAIDSDITLRCAAGAIIVPAGGVEVTIGGALEAGAYQIFDTSATGSSIAFGDRIREVYPEWWGIQGAIGMDDTTALNSALALGQGRVVLLSGGTYFFEGDLVVGSGTTIQGVGPATVLYAKNATGNTVRVTGGNVILRDFKLTTDQTDPTPGGIRVVDGADGVTFQGIHFEHAGQCVWLFECQNIAVEGCRFEGTGYGVIQQASYASSHVRVVNSTAVNVRADFVEANCTANAPSEDWIITGNQFLGNRGFPNEGTEDRFVGVTAVKDVKITNNFVKNTAGDGAIHLEDIRGRTIIANNHFENCVGSHAYLYILNTEKDTLIVGNVFVHDDPTLPAEWVMDLSSAQYSNPIVFANNRVIGTGAGTFNALNLAWQSNCLIEGNFFQGLHRVIKANGCGQVLLHGNIILNCEYGIIAVPGSVGGPNDDWSVVGNRFICSEKAIEVRRNTNGTNPSKRWTVAGNHFAAPAEAYDTEDMHAAGNTRTSGVMMNFGLAQYTGSVRATRSGNTEFGTGVVD